MHHHPRRHRRPLIEPLELRQLLTAVTVHSARAPESAGELTFHVTLDAPADHPVSLTYTTLPGTATPNTDYTPAHGTLTLPAGKTESDITIPVKNDHLYERRETLSLALRAIGATLNKSSVQGTITNDDAAPVITLKNVHTREGDAGRHAVTLTAKLSAPAGTPVSLTYATSDDSPYFGAATAGVDYTAAAGRITFLPGQTSQTIVVYVTGDPTRESAETFHVSLSHDSLLTPSDATATPTVVTLGSSSPVATSTVTIKNDDKRSPADVPVLSAPAFLAIDENAPSPSLTVTLSKPSSKPVTFRYTAAEAKEPTLPVGIITFTRLGDAPIGSNFTRHADVVTIPAGQTSVTVPLPILNDNQHQPSDTVRVRLSNVDGASLPNGLPTASTHITLTDSDLPFFFTLANPPMLTSAIDPSRLQTIQIQPDTLAQSGTAFIYQPVTAWPTSPNDGVLHLDSPGVIYTGQAVASTPYTGSISFSNPNLYTGSGAFLYTLTGSTLIRTGITVDASTHTFPSTATGSDASNGTLTIRSITPTSILTNSNPLPLSTLASLDLPTSALILSNTTPDAARALLLSAFNAGTWTGPNVPATPASTDPSHRTALAYAPQPDGSVLLKPALYGDANLDGTVDSADAAIVQQSLSDPSTPPSWSTGDFNYDNHITPDDLTLLDRNLGHSLS